MRVRVALTLTLAAAATGLGTFAAVGTLPAATAQSSSPTFGSPVTVGTGASEPDIAVAPNGRSASPSRRRITSRLRVCRPGDRVLAMPSPRDPI